MRAEGKLEGPGHWLTVAWQEALLRVLEAMSGPAPASAMTARLERPDPPAWMDWPSPTWCELVLQGVEGGAVRAGAPRATVEMIARLISGDAASTEEASRETFFEVVNQTASTTGDVISARLGKRVSFAPAQLSEAPAEWDYALKIDLSLDGSGYEMALAPNAALMETLGAISDSASLPAVITVPPATAPPSLPGREISPGFASTGAPGNLDLLMEVELPLCVTFGRTQLPLKDVLKLSSGSTVELNRLANEPVEVLINNCIIARGEVVAVDGNYGIRVTEIVSRQERIRSIL